MKKKTLTHKKSFYDKNSSKNRHRRNLPQHIIYGLHSLENIWPIYLVIYMKRKYMTNLESILKSRDITLPTKVHLVRAMVFSVVMYKCELDYKESWAPKNWRFWTVMLQKTLESPLDCKEIQPVHTKGNTHWKDRCGSWNSNTLATWCEEITYWKRPSCWERLKAGGAGDDRLDGHEFE